MVSNLPEGKNDNSPASSDSTESKYSSLKDKINTTSDTLQNISNDVEIDIDTSNKYLDEIQGRSRKSLADISDLYERQKAGLDEIYEFINSKMIFIVVLTPIIFYVIYFVLYNGKLEWPGILGVIITIIEYLMFVFIQDSIENQKGKLEEAIKEISLELNSVVNKYDGYRETQQTKNNNIKNSHRTVSDYLKVTGNLLKSYDPTVQAFYKERELRFELHNFTTTLRNSLIYYGYPIQGKSEQYLISFYSNSDGVNKWLNESSKELAIKLGIPQQLITLAYADYTGDIPTQRNIWLEIKEKESIQAGLVKNLLKNGKIKIEKEMKQENLMEGLRSLMLSMEIFSLECFVSRYYSFHSDLATEKKTLIDSMRRYGIVTITPDIARFMPIRPYQESISEELIEYLSEGTGISRSIIELIRFEEKGDILKKNQSWELIKRDVQLLEEFAQLLLDHNCIAVPVQYLNNPQLPSYFSSHIRIIENYSITEANRVIIAAFDGLLNMKKDFITALSLFDLIDNSEIEKLNEYLISDNSELVCAEHLSNLLETNNKVILLLYYDVAVNKRKKSAIFEEMRGTNDIQVLTKIFLRNMDIITSSHPYEEYIANSLPTMLNNIDAFDADKIVFTIVSYSALIEYSIDIDNFLLEQGISENSASNLNISEILDSMNVTIKDNILDQLKIIVENIINSYNIMGQDHVDWCYPISISCLSFYLCVIRDKNRINSCREASSNKSACDILYQISKMREEDERKQKNLSTPIREIIKGVMEGKYTKGEFIESFSMELESGRFLKIGDLVQVRFDSVQRTLDRVDKSQLLSNKIKKMGKAVETFLGTHLNNTFVIRALNNQIISAYILTTSSSEKVLSEIIDKRIVENLSYDKLIIIFEGNSGRYTRLGLVPFEMDFDTFSRRFESIFNQEVQNFRDSDPRKKTEAFSINVIRVFPSDDYFKQVGGSDSDDENPIVQIRRMILQKYGHIQTLQLLATVDEKQNKTLALRHVIANLMSESSIYLLSQDKIDSITQNKEIIKILNSKQFSWALAKSFNCIGILELSNKIHKLYQLANDSEKANTAREFTDTFVNLVRESVQYSRTKDVEIISKIVLDSLLEVGAVMDAFVDQYE